MKDQDVDKIMTKLDMMDDHLVSVDKTLIEQHESLKYHIKRSDASEERIGHVEDALTEKVLPHINQVTGGIKLLGIVSLVLGIIVAIYKLIGN